MRSVRIVREEKCRTIEGGDPYQRCLLRILILLLAAFPLFADIPVAAPELRAATGVQRSIELAGLRGRRAGLTIVYERPATFDGTGVAEGVGPLTSANVGPALQPAAVKYDTAGAARRNHASSGPAGEPALRTLPASCAPSAA